MSHREASASAQKAWSSAGRRGPRFGVGAGVCLGWAAARDVACVWAPWGVLGEGKARGWAAGAGEGWVHAWGEGIGGVAIDVYGYGYGGWRGRLAYGWAWA
ncbi:MAG: hypothetical protein PUE65_02550 [Mollicutes bacterium]|nr:hypothetical protein [Mollicutes bacterium]